ncbi:alpha/beta fold hydrolase [Pseudonocardia halophobica]|uniref:alpha/beta fold hydrolase n=1 Tax=Pseudonocardia halophobica TaxID=29401 RepID=UPI003D919720
MAETGGRRAGADLQAVVDELADELGRSVVVNDPVVRMLVTSRHFGDEDEVRVRALLQRDAGADVARHVLDQGVARWSRAGAVPERPDLGLRAAVRPDAPPRGAPRPFVEEQIRLTPPHAGVPLLWDHCAQDWRDVLPRLDRPTLVIGCEGSHVDPASQRYIAENVPGAELHVFPREVASSHFPFLQNPAAFNEVVEAFLDRP